MSGTLYNMTRLISTTFIMSIILLTISSSFQGVMVEAALTRGKCVPFPTFAGVFINGYDESICRTILMEAGYTHFFIAEGDQLPSPGGPFPEGSDPYDKLCASETFYTQEQATKRLMNSFTRTQPTGICQNVLLASSCLHDIKVCDPDVDFEEYVTEEKHKPCHWTCDIIRSATNLQEICNSTDLQFLATAGVDITPGSATPTTEYFNCESSRYAAPGVEDLVSGTGQTMCVSPQFISSEPQAARCEEYTGDVCGAIFPSGTSIYVPGGATQAQIEFELTNAAFVLNSLPIVEDSTCVQDTLRIYCSSMFRECVSHGVARFSRDTNGQPLDSTRVLTTKALALTAPIDNCDMYRENCENTGLFTLYKAALGLKTLANCDTDRVYHQSYCIPAERRQDYTVSSSYSFNQPNFVSKTGYSSWAIDAPNNYVYVGTTSAASTIANVQWIPYIDCTAPLVQARLEDAGIRTVFGATNERTRCTFPCPTPVYSQSERNELETIAWVFVLFALISSALLALTFTIFHSQRHKHLLFWYVVTYFGAAFMLFLGLIVRIDGSLWQTQCETTTQYRHFEGFALFQGLFLIYFLCVSTGFWLMQAIDLYQRLILGLQFRRGSTADFRRKIAMHFFCWGSPILVIIAICIAEQIGYDKYLPFAWITMNHDANISARYSTTWVFFTHFFICIGAGLILVGIIFVFLVRYTDPTEGLKKFNAQMEDKKSSTWFKIQQMLKLFGFIFLAIPIFVILVARHAVVSANLDAWNLSQDNWGKELAISLQGVNFLSKLPLEPLTDKLPVGLVAATIFAMCSPGIVMFILYFLLSADVYGLWIGLFYYNLNIQCCKRWAKEDTATGSDGSGGSSQGSSSGGSSGSAGTGGSNDLFSGGMLLTKRARDNANRSDHGDGSASGGDPSTAGSNGSGVGTNSGVSDAAKTPATTTSTLTSSKDQKRALFKGMTKSSQDQRAISRVSGGPGGGMSFGDGVELQNCSEDLSRHSSRMNFDQMSPDSEVGGVNGTTSSGTPLPPQPRKIAEPIFEIVEDDETEVLQGEDNDVRGNDDKDTDSQ